MYVLVLPVLLYKLRRKRKNKRVIKPRYFQFALLLATSFFKKKLDWLMGGLLVWGAVVLSAWGAGARMRTDGRAGENKTKNKKKRE
jgi:asparagine N-glycosylation enzyme membrane subunit Stt3